MAEKNYLPGAYYRYSLIIKKLLATPLRDSPDRQIVYSDRHRYTYKDFEKRTAMLANGLATLGLRPGETVAVFDYDSHLYWSVFSPFTTWSPNDTTIFKIYIRWPKTST